MLESGITEGRIVHYVRNGECDAAIIVDAQSAGKVSNVCSLRIFSRSHLEEGDAFDPHADYSVERSDHTWHWPLDHKVD